MQRAIRILTCGLLLACVVQPAGSQGIIIDATDMQAIFAVGSTIAYHVDTLTKSADIGTPEATEWNFEDLNTTSITNLESMTVASTPYAADFPQATFALRDAGFTYSFYYAAIGSDVTLKGTGYVFYDVQSSVQNLGLKGAGDAYILGTPYPAQGQWVNSPPSVDYALPLQLATTWTTDYTEAISGTATLGTLTLPFGPLTTTHSITYTVDAYGRVTLPGGVVRDALRIRKVDKFNSGGTPGVRVGYILVSKNGATVKVTVTDTSAISGTVDVSDVQWSTGRDDLDVPIQLSSFTAVPQGEESVLLEWTTLSETGNFGFYIQRKSSDEKEFVDVPGAFIAGHGTTVVPQRYSYLVSDRGADGWWYRLKQVDLDGTVYFSEAAQVRAVTSVQEITPIACELSQNYPNPFNPSTTIRYGLPQKSHVTLTVSNTLGQQVATLVQGEQSAGYHEVKFDGSGLSSGVYVYRMHVRPLGSSNGRDSENEAGGVIQIRRLLLLK